MTRSRRHHYIPQFLIKNFTDVDGQIYVYDKLEKRILDSKRSPKQIFYEFDRNTVNFSGIPLDNLEQLYSSLDSKLASDLSDVLKNIESHKGISPESVVSIIILACMLKWRTPMSDATFNELKEDTSQEELNIRITIKDKNMVVDPQAISFIENSNIFKETKRVMLPFLPLLDDENLVHIHNNSFINTNDRFPSVIGDCPIVEKPNSNFRAIENFIFPLSSKDIFIYHTGADQTILNPLFYLQKDLALLHLSQKYIACKSKEHLEKIVKMYDIICAEKKEDLIPKFLFNYLG